MTRRSQVLLAAAVLFVAVNLAGAGYAVALSEMPHAGIHVVLALLGAYPVWRLTRRRGSGGAGRAGATELPADSAAVAEQLRRLEQSLDAVALEVERIGEGQRYLTRLFSEHAPLQAVGEGGDRVESGAAPGAGGA